MKIYICDFINPASDDLESFVVEAVDENEAKLKSFEELKTLGIPKRYLIKIEEVI